MNLGILLWNTCNAKCSHCAVNSSPTEVGYMSDEQIFSLIDATFCDTSDPAIGLSGGEAFLYFDRLCRIIRYATDRGARVSVNTNGFWGTTVMAAVEKVRVLNGIGLRRMVVSMDGFHDPYINRARPLYVIRACKSEHLEVELQFVATKSTTRLADLLAAHSDVLLNIQCREIPCHPVGRAAVMVPDADLLTDPGIPGGLCPSAILSISAYGKVIPCCNTAGHLPALQIGTIDEPLVELHEKFRNSRLMNTLLRRGPKALVPAAVEAGYEVRPGGYVDQCHLCYEVFRDSQIAAAVTQAADDIHAEDLFDRYRTEYETARAAEC
jgi:hypothetical protein